LAASQDRDLVGERGVCRGHRLISSTAVKNGMVSPSPVFSNATWTRRPNRSSAASTPAMDVHHQGPSSRACLRSEGSEPFADGGDVEGGFVADGELVVPGGDGAVALEPADGALDGVPLLVLLLVEGPGPAA
jgi:hypothetical protein